MAFVHGKNAGVFVGSNDLSSYFQGTDLEASCASHDVTTYSKTTATVQRAAGLWDGKVSLSGLFDATADAILAAFIGSASGEVFTFCPYQTSLGQAFLGVVQHASYKMSNPVGGMVTVSAELVCRSDFEPGGQMLRTLSQSATSANGSTVDSGAASTNGGIATIHCTAFSGTSVAVKIQHSTDGSSWADLTGGAFSTLSAVGSERITIAAGTTVNRYIREYHTHTSATATYIVAFARR